MSRYPDIAREELTPEGQASWDYIAGSRGAVRGPYAPLISVPPLAEGVARLGTYLRFEGLLTGADRELAILAVARELGSHYEWVAHEPIARREGARPEAIDVVRTASALEGLLPRERTIVEVAQALYRQRALSDDLFARARATLGQERLTELVALVGYYGMIAFTLLAFEVARPDGTPAPF
jgi:4-carboxymuconolactone decarboxylase